MNDPEPTRDASPRTDPVRNDLYCLHCGYNLRGLLGDPLRCPECGHENPREMVDVPTNAITAHIRRMEHSAAGAVGCLVIWPVLALPVARVVLVMSQTRSVLAGAACASLLALSPLAGWIWNCHGFRSVTGGRVGWFGALMKYHVNALLLIALLVVILGGISLGLFWLFMPKYVSESGLAKYSVTMILVGIAVVWLIKPVISPLHRRLVNSVEPLRREIAIGLTREYLRKQMQVGPRRRSQQP